MPIDVARRFLQRARQYARTAEAALSAGDHDAAFENARTAAELAAKAMLEQAGHRYGSDHNVAGALVQAGLWPKAHGAALSKLLAEYVRGVYAFTNPISERDARRALQTAERVLRATADEGHP